MEIEMKYTSIPAKVSLADPETRFYFQRVESSVVLSYRDWQDSEVIITFKNAERFSYTWYPPYPDIAEECFIEIIDSPLIEDLVSKSHITENEKLKHILISSNADEWCEAICEEIEIG